MGAHCRVLEANGALRLNRFGRPTVRTLLFPASDATLLDTWRTIGLRGTASDSYCVNDVFVSEAFSTTREDPTLRRERGPLYAFTMQCLYATGVAAVARFHEPGGLSATSDALWVADTNNHVIRRVALSNGECSTVQLRGISGERP